CYHDVARNAAKVIAQELDQSTLSPERRMERLFELSQMALFDGDFERAAPAMEEARALIERNPTQFGRGLSTVIYLQGIIALRRGETENCVQCQGEGSCIFPIQLRAVHGKKRGSHDAIKYFTEYLRLVPNDIRVRWLLNVAHMTVGQYPDQVPSEYLIPL